MKRFKQLLVLVLGLLSVALAENLGSVATNLNVPIDLARHFFTGGSYVLGAGFLVAAFFRYMRFRQNSQETPISMVIVLLLIGLGLIALPFSYQLSHHLAIQQGVGDVVSSS